MVRFTTCSSRSTSELGCSTSYALSCQLETPGSRSEKLVFELLPLRAAASGGKPKTKKNACALFAAIGLNIPSPGNSHQGNKANFLKSGKTPDGFELLPVGSRIGGRQQQYVWDGKAIKIIDTEELASKQTKRQHLSSQLREWRRAVQSSFLPDKDLVTGDYWAYSFWRNSHRFFSSATTVFATQSLLQAVGVGAKNSLPAAAGINWVLKDGLGRLGRLSVSTRFGTSFDSNLKRFRFSTSLVYACAVGLEFLTPLAPRYFLLLASIANVGKSVGLATHISTQPSFVKNFARQDNLADLTAKAQAQQMVADNMGLALAVSLSWACRSDPRARQLLPLMAFPLLATGDLCSIYRELKSIHLRNLNKERAEIVAEMWLEAGRIPSAAEVSKRETLLIPHRRGEGSLPLRIGSLDRTIASPEQLHTLLHRHKDEKYVMAHQQLQLSHLQRLMPSAKKVPGGVKGRVSMTLQDGATTSDILTGILQAAFFRQLIASRCATDEQRSDSGTAADKISSADKQRSAVHARGCSQSDMDGMLAESLRYAKGDVKRFVQETERAGWNVHPIMLSSFERMSFSQVS
ncbi:hypothetical protein ABBQ32_005271 [Trebouxia sp. C0010 RCD-2024]